MQYMADYLMVENSEHCERCEKPVGLVWFTANELWAKISGHPDGDGILCIYCFDQLADEQGIFLAWQADVYKTYQERMENVGRE